MVERSSKEVIVSTLDGQVVVKGAASKPASKADVHDPIMETLRDGSIGSADGSQAMRSSILASGVPHQYVHHGRQPVKQFTKLAMHPKELASEKLGGTMKAMHRWSEGLSSIKSCAGN